MILRQEFSEGTQLPPRPFLEQIMDSLSKAYCFLWDMKDDSHQVDLRWKDLSKHYNKNAFRTSIRKLGNQGLLSYYESDEGIHIELVSWEEVDGE